MKPLILVIAAAVVTVVVMGCCTTTPLEDQASNGLTVLGWQPPPYYLKKEDWGKVPFVKNIEWVVKTASQPAVPLWHKRDTVWLENGTPIQLLTRSEIDKISAEIVDSARWSPVCEGLSPLGVRWVGIFWVDTLPGFKWIRGEVTQEKLMRHPQVCRFEWYIQQPDIKKLGLYSWSKVRGIEAWDAPQQATWYDPADQPQIVPFDAFTITLPRWLNEDTGAYLPYGGRKFTGGDITIVVQGGQWQHESFVYLPGFDAGIHSAGLRDSIITINGLECYLVTHVDPTGCAVYLLLPSKPNPTFTSVVVYGYSNKASHLDWLLAVLQTVRKNE